MSTYNDASLLLIPSGSKTGKLHCLKPKDESGYFAVTGGGNAVSQRPDGYLEVGWPANTPRFKHNAGVPSILVESQRQNLITYPRSFGNAYWTKTGATIEGDPATAGSELVNNGGFDTDTDWTKGTGWSIESGTANANCATNINLSQTVTLTVGKWYKAQLTVSNYTSGGVRVVINNSVVIATISENKTEYGYFKYAANNSLLINTQGATVLSVDNVSIKEVQGFSCPFVDSSGINTLEGVKLVEDESTGSHNLYQFSTPVTLGQKYTKYLIAKAGTADFAYIRFGSQNSAFTLSTAYFDLSNGVVGSAVGEIESLTIEPLVDGYYLCTATITATATATGLTNIGMSQIDNSSSYAGDGTSYIYICHAQLEQAASASSPIYGTEGSALTCLADNHQVDLPSGVTEVELTDSEDVVTTDESPADPYIIPVGEWKKIIMT